MMDLQDKLEIEMGLIQAEIIIEIERYRELHGLRKKDIANKLGVSPSFLSQIYTMNKYISLNFLARIQRLLDVNIGFKFTDREEVRIVRSPKRKFLKQR